ncbi:O-antigen ligase family protein [bacterium]|nr:O-antigen ligase family protein [bacterium]
MSDFVIQRFFGNEISVIERVQNDPRLIMWEVATGIVKNNLWSGIGIANFQLLNPLGLSNCHNLYLSILNERGLFVLIAFILIMALLFYYI